MTSAPPRTPLAKPRVGIAGAVLCAGALLGGCFDFGALQPTPSDDGGDGGHDSGNADADGSTPAAPCTPWPSCSRLRPKFWTLPVGPFFPAEVDDVTIPGIDGRDEWVLSTAADGSAPVMYAFDAIPGGVFPGEAAGRKVEGLDFEFVELPGAVSAVVWFTKNFTLRENARLYVFGARPLVIVASESIVIAGTLDAGGGALKVSDALQPGAGASACLGGGVGGAGQPFGNHGNGGGGGSYGTRGGAGGRLAPGEEPADPGDLLSEPATLRGGCPGGAGAEASDDPNGQPAAGGTAGGAVQLIGLETLELSGIVNVGGGGGRTARSAGGGGGGSGGMLILESPTLRLTGVSGAPGGGGGQGALCYLCSGSWVGARGIAGAAPNGAPGGAKPVGELKYAVGGAGSAFSGMPTAGGDVYWSMLTGFSGGGGGGGGAGIVIVRTASPKTAADFPDATFDPVVETADPESGLPFTLPRFETLAYADD